MKNGVDVPEETVPSHEDFGPAAFFCWRAVEADGSLNGTGFYRSPDTHEGESA